MKIFSWDYETCVWTMPFFLFSSHQSLHRVYGSLAMMGVLRWWWLSTWCGTLCGASQHQNLLFALAKWRYFLEVWLNSTKCAFGHHRSLHRVYIWLCQWGVLRWRWLSTWCGTLPSASLYLDLVASTKWRYFLGTIWNLCVNYAFSFQ